MIEWCRCVSCVGPCQLVFWLFRTLMCADLMPHYGIEIWKNLCIDSFDYAFKSRKLACLYDFIGHTVVGWLVGFIYPGP